jgi:hypothetical protein
MGSFLAGQGLVSGQLLQEAGEAGSVSVCNMAMDCLLVSGQTSFKNKNNIQGHLLQEAFKRELVASQFPQLSRGLVETQCSELFLLLTLLSLPPCKRQ